MGRYDGMLAYTTMVQDGQIGSAHVSNRKTLLTSLRVSDSMLDVRWRPRNWEGYKQQDGVLLQYRKL